MKKLVLIAVFSSLAFTGMCQQNAGDTPYKTGLGLLIDVGEGITLVGPHLKHFLNGRDAVQGMVIFGSGLTILGAEYSYNARFPDAKGLMWNLGIGPQLGFYDGETAFVLRPMAGLEFKVPSAPISLGFDWRPMWDLSEDSEFIPGRFGIAFRYTF